MSKVEVPQSTLDRISAVVRAVPAAGGNANAIRLASRISARHVHYSLAAARILRLIVESDGRVVRTPLGDELAGTVVTSEAEASVLRRAIAESETLATIAPDLLGPIAPGLQAIVKRIEKVAGLSANTATHRARMILKWRRRLAQSRLPFAGSSEEPAAAKARAAHAAVAVSIDDESIEIRSGALGPIPACELAIRPMTVFVGPQGSGKSLLAQMLYFFRALPELVPVVVASMPRSERNAFSVEALVRNLLDGLRSPQRAFAGFADPSVTIRWREEGQQEQTLGFGAYSWNRRVRPDKHLLAYVSALLGSSSAVSRAIFIPTERLFYSQVRSPLASQLLSLPNTFAWFSAWMQRATDIFETWANGAPDTPRGRWVRARARSALRGEAYRWQEAWKWRFPKAKGRGTLDLDMASSGQRATWPLVLLAETLFSLRKRHQLDDSFSIYVEEPEIHLHPEAQVAVVEILAYLVNNGFRVVITTHSLTVLYALNNLILAGAAKNRRGSRGGLPLEVTWLDGSAVAAYAFGTGKPKNLVDAETGFISEADLGSVSEQLNQTMNRLSERLYQAP